MNFYKQLYKVHWGFTIFYVIFLFIYSYKSISHTRVLLYADIISDMILHAMNPYQLALANTGGPWLIIGIDIDFTLRYI